MPKVQMLIDYVSGEECRIAITEDGKLEELYQERASSESHVGNIYKGRVTNVEPSIQAAFVEFGLERNGFLHISDLHPMYFPGDLREEFERVGLKTPRRERPPIQKCLRRGDQILVQVIKEGIGTKGPTLTSYLSIPGRFIVMMPHMQKLGVSRKVEDDDHRREMRKMLDELNPPEGFGFIVRTAGMGRTKSELKRDLSYLHRLWKSIETRQKKTNIGELYTESDLIIRTIRDVFTTDIDRIIVNEPSAARRASDFLNIASPRTSSKVVYYNDSIPLFHRFQIEEQIENIHSRTVELPSGIHLVIDSTEALVAIDVNSGKNRKANDAETNAYKVNMEAVDEICRQLRLRDLGGVIVIDFIDMFSAKHRRAVEQRFRQNLKKDRARTRVGSISQFGLLEMTRQRMRPSLKKSIYMDCEMCQGAGQVKSPESVVLDVMRRLALVLHRKNIAKIELTVSPGVAFQLLNHRRQQLANLERSRETEILVRVNSNGSADYVQITALDQRGNRVNIEHAAPLGEPVFETVEAMIEVDDEHYAESVERSDALQTETIVDTEDAQTDEESVADPANATEEEDKPKRKRRRRRGGRGRKKSQTEQTGTDSEQDDASEEVAQRAEDDEPADVPHASEFEGKKQQASEESSQAETQDEMHAQVSAEHAAESDDVPRKKSRRRRGRRGGRGRSQSGEAPAESGSPAPVTDTVHEDTAESGGAVPVPTEQNNDQRKDRAKAPAEEDEASPAEADSASKPRKRRRSKRKVSIKPQSSAAASSVEKTAAASESQTSVQSAEKPAKKPVVKPAPKQPAAASPSSGYRNKRLQGTSTDPK